MMKLTQRKCQHHAGRIKLLTKAREPLPLVKQRDHPQDHPDLILPTDIVFQLFFYKLFQSALIGA